MQVACGRVGSVRPICLTLYQSAQAAVTKYHALVFYQRMVFCYSTYSLSSGGLEV